MAAEVKNFDCSQLLSPKEIKKTSRFSQLAISASHEALQDSEILLKSNMQDIGCILGVGVGALGYISEASIQLKESGSKKISSFSSHQ